MSAGVPTIRMVRSRTIPIVRTSGRRRRLLFLDTLDDESSSTVTFSGTFTDLKPEIMHYVTFNGTFSVAKETMQFEHDVTFIGTFTVKGPLFDGRYRR